MSHVMRNFSKEHQNATPHLEEGEKNLLKAVAVSWKRERSFGCEEMVLAFFCRQRKKDR